MPLVLATVDAMCLNDRERIIKKLGGTALWKNSEAGLLDFFCGLSREGVHVCPIELIKAQRTDLDDLADMLARVLARKLGLEYKHVAIGCGGNAHDAFELDITLGRRTTESIEDAFSRGRVLNDERAFRNIARALTICTAEEPTVLWAPNAAELEFKMEHHPISSWISGS